MAEKKIIGRAIQKHDIEANWLKSNFVPLQGELIVYDAEDGTYSYERLKIGDGVKNVNALPFVDDALRDTILEQINSVDDKVNAISDLVGDEKVSDQIEAAKEVYAQNDEPQDAKDGALWIDLDAYGASDKAVVYAPNEASVGQVLVVADVDEDGKPVAWGAASPLDTYVVSGIDKTGTTDVTVLLQAAIDKAYNEGFNRVEFEPGAYLISTQNIASSGNNTWCGGLKLYSNTEYDFRGATLKMAPTSSIAYNILYLEYLENVTVLNVELIGDRAEHDYDTYSAKTHEFGYAIGQYSCKNVRYENIVAHDCTGDAIFWGFGSGGSEKWTSEYYNYNCVVKNSEFYNTRRNGLSPCCIVNLTLDNVHIHDIGITIDGIAGTAPKMGIDFEPYTEYEWVENVLLKNSVIENTESYPIGVPRAVNVQIDGCKIISNGTFVQSIYTSDTTVTTVHVKNTKFVGFDRPNGYIDSYENCDMGGMAFCRTPTSFKNIGDRIFIANNCINAATVNVFNYQASKIKAAYITNCHFITWLPVYIYAEYVLIDNCAVDASLSKGFYQVNAHADNTVVSNCNIKVIKDVRGAQYANSIGTGDILYTGCKFHLVHSLELESDYDIFIRFLGKHEGNDFICEGVGAQFTSARNCNFEIRPTNNTLINAPAYFKGDAAYNCIFDSSKSENIKFNMGVAEQYRCVWKVNHSKNSPIDISATTKSVQNIFENIGSVEAKWMPNYNAALYTFTDHGSLWINSALRSY